MLDSEIRDLAELGFRVTEQLISANALLAELGQQGADSAADAAGTRARVRALEQEKAALDRQAAARRTALAALRSRLFRTEDRIRAAQSRFDTLSLRATEMAVLSGTRTDQLRLIDPGVVPQQPSFPRPALFIAASIMIALVLSVVYLTLQFGLARQRTNRRETELRVGRGNH